MGVPAVVEAAVELVGVTLEAEALRVPAVAGVAVILGPSRVRAPLENGLGGTGHHGRCPEGVVLAETVLRAVQGAATDVGALKEGVGAVAWGSPRPPTFHPAGCIWAESRSDEDCATSVPCVGERRPCGRSTPFARRGFLDLQNRGHRWMGQAAWTRRKAGWSDLTPVTNTETGVLGGRLGGRDNGARPPSNGRNRRGSAAAGLPAPGGTTTGEVGGRAL